MTLQIKNNSKLWILLCLAFFLTSCTVTVEQTISSEGKATTSISVPYQGEKDFCQQFLAQLNFFDETCTQNSNSVEISGSYYVNANYLQVEENIFTTKYTYDLKDIELTIKELNSLYLLEEIENFEANIKVTLPGSVTSEDITVEDGEVSISYSKYNSLRNPSITSTKYHVIPILIVTSLFIVLFLIAIVLYKKKNIIINHQLPKEQTQELSQEEVKCRQYVLQFQEQYSKEVLYQGLVNSGIQPQYAKYYVIKYYTKK
ncbi:MAG: hypothetical protein VXZ40_03790 [Nanoarchaeota archaeon]|nr:hypothetical protein [Nanoarchaeota archaeon]